MKNPANYLQEAMFIASESYSGSAYETDLFYAMDSEFDDEFVFLNEGNETVVIALAA